MCVVGPSIHFANTGVARRHFIFFILTYAAKATRLSYSPPHSVHSPGERSLALQNSPHLTRHETSNREFKGKAQRRSEKIPSRPSRIVSNSSRSSPRLISHHFRTWGWCRRRRRETKKKSGRERGLVANSSSSYRVVCRVGIGVFFVFVWFSFLKFWKRTVPRADL